jgi:tetratricopeptide (TPR) repeat protein
MNFQFLRTSVRFLGGLFVCGLLTASVAFAQTGGGQQQPPASTQDQTKPATPPAQAEQQKSDPEEDAAYKAFFDTKADNADQKIKLGESFVQKYPGDQYSAQVYAGLTQAYFDKQEYDKMFKASDKALALNPDNVDVLVLIGWYIPHDYNPNDIDAERRLDKAERYLTQAVKLLASTQKPNGMTDDDFNKAKQEKTSMAHSGLGMVYFRRGQAEQSAAEAKQAVDLAAKPDPVDYLVLGRELQALKRYQESADAYQKCAAIATGDMQQRCKKQADDAKKLAASQPAASKP